MKPQLFHLLSLSAILSISAISHAQIIDTQSPWIATGRIGGTGPFGEAGPGVYEVFGQTFVAPNGYNRLDSFTWSMQRGDVFGPDSTEFAAYVAKWDPVKLTVSGGILFESSPSVMADADQVWRTFKFSTGGLLLDTTQAYIMFISAAPFYDGVRGAVNVAVTTLDRNGDTYLGGKAYLGSSLSTIDTDPWIRPANESAGFGVADFATEAHFSNFSPVPEPSMYGFAASVLLGGMIWRRRKAGSLHQEKRRSLSCEITSVVSDPNGSG